MKDMRASFDFNKNVATFRIDRGITKILSVT